MLRKRMTPSSTAPRTRPPETFATHVAKPGAFMTGRLGAPSDGRQFGRFATPPLVYAGAIPRDQGQSRFRITSAEEYRFNPGPSAAANQLAGVPDRHGPCRDSGSA